MALMNIAWLAVEAARYLNDLNEIGLQLSN